MNLLPWASVLCRDGHISPVLWGAYDTQGFRFDEVSFTLSPFGVIKKKKSLPNLISCVFFRQYHSFRRSVQVFDSPPFLNLDAVGVGITD